MKRVLATPLNPHLYAALQVALSAACFGAMAVFARQAYREGVDPVALLFIRFSLAGCLLVAVMRIRRVAWPRGPSLRGLILMGGIGYVSQSLSFFSALKYAPAAVVALLLYLHPLLIAIAARVVFGEALTAGRVLCILAALVGISMVLGLGAAAGQWQGYAFGSLAAVLYAAYLMTGQRVLHAASPLASATTVMVSAAVVFGLLALLNPPQWPVSGASWGAAGAIAIISTVFAMLLLFAGMRTLGATNAATISTLEPVITAILGTTLLGERLDALQWSGIGLVVSSVLMLVRSSAGKTTPATDTGK